MEAARMKRNLWIGVAAILICRAFTGAAQDTAIRPPPPTTTTSGQADWIQLSPTAAMQLSLDHAISRKTAIDQQLAKDQEIAAQEFEAIQVKLAAFIKQYPHTKAGKSAAGMIDRAGLRVGPNGYDGLYPGHTFFSGAAINR